MPRGGWRCSRPWPRPPGSRPGAPRGCRSSRPSAMSDAAPALALALVLATATAAAPVLSPDAILRAADGPRQAIEEGGTRIRATAEEEGNEPAVSDLDV